MYCVVREAVCISCPHHADWEKDSYSSVGVVITKISTCRVSRVVLHLVGKFHLVNIAWFSIMRGSGSPETPLKANVAVAHLECKGKDRVNTSDWLYDCMSIQLCPEAVLTASVGTGPRK